MPADDRGTQARSGVVTGGNLTASLREAFYRVVTMEDYEMFSTKKRLDNTRVQAWGSAESLHDKLHLWCGGGYFGEPAHGHMSWVPVAAFDPIFWLHHNNVDRLFAIWQTLHPKSENKKNWFDDKARAQEGLLPFRKNEDGEYWNSDDVYETADLGYTYSILPKKRDAAGKVVLDRPLDELKKELNELYGATRRAEQKAAVTGVQPEPLKVADALQFNTIAKIQAQIINTNTGTPEAPKVEDQLDVYDYIANVKYERFALQGMPFTIHVLIGKAPENDTPMDAVEYKNVVGQVFNFAAPLEMNHDDNSNNGHTTTQPGGCANCEKQAKEKSESTGQVVLTNALITRYKQQIIHENRDDASQVLASMEPADVIEFLKKNLHWRITGASGSIIPKEQIPSLKVAIAVGKADHYADPTKLSVYRDYEVMYDVTAGRAGGAAPEDNLFAPGTEYHG
ncbi:hypothetical protein N7G274_007995 [Stereocaulon virgatum]|uniref:tyrosinase n=1 Tax=Stereocaulon virgatum TaxID=373712 RepID=A0ABR4A063_9LECA